MLFIFILSFFILYIFFFVHYIFIMFIGTFPQQFNDYFLFFRAHKKFTLELLQGRTVIVRPQDISAITFI